MGIERVCGRYEENVGQIKRHFKEVVAEGCVLLGVKRFEQCSRRVAAIVRAELIYLSRTMTGFMLFA